MSDMEHPWRTQAVVEIFKTNVMKEKLAKKIIADLQQLYPDYCINFDLEDADKVLRIEGHHSVDIMGILNYGLNHHIQIELIDG